MGTKRPRMLLVYQKSGFLLRKLISVTILLLVVPTVPPVLAGKGNLETEKVVIIFLGGISNSEVFDDSTHAYVPRIWQNIRPHGVVYRDFFNMAFTGMGTGTFEAIMGVRRDENNRGTSWRGLSPTMFEYYRKDRQVSQDKVWAVLSNDFDCFGIDHGLHPAYGPTFAAAKWASTHNDDIETFHEALRVMHQHKPSLLSIHFRDPDREAQHTHNPNLADSIAWENYTRAVAVVDSLVNLVWTVIQLDTAYAGKTALFITCAHGRHTQQYGGFEWHGDACNGCRRVPFLAVGPDFKAGETIDTRGDLIDLCPTVGELLGFDPIFARGRVLGELFEESYDERLPVGEGSDIEPYLLSSPGVTAHSPHVEAVGDVVHAIWTERNTDEVLESWDIMYTRSQTRGEMWSEPNPVFITDDPAEKVQTVASLSGDESGISVTTALYKQGEYWYGDTSWYWDAECKISLDGTEWPEQSTSIVDKQKLITIDNIPATALRDSAVVTALLADRWNRYFAVNLDFGETWYNIPVDVAPEDLFTSPNHPSVALADRLYYVESVRFTYRSRLPFFSSAEHDILFRSIADDTNSESLFPQLVHSDSVLYCVWNDNRTGNWEVHFSRSTDSGYSWSPAVQLSEGGVNTWGSALEASNDTLLVVWEDYRRGASSLYKKVSFDGGLSWSDEYAEVTSPGLSSFPKLSHSNGAFYMVWQDYISGTWQVYCKQVGLVFPY